MINTEALTAARLIPADERDLPLDGFKVAYAVENWMFDEREVRVLRTE